MNVWLKNLAKEKFGEQALILPIGENLYWWQSYACITRLLIYGYTQGELFSPDLLFDTTFKFSNYSVYLHLIHLC